MNSKINKAFQLSPLSAFFIPLSLQLGADFLILPNPLTEQSGQDAWIGIMISGLSTLVILWLIFRLLENECIYGRADIFSLHQRLFGKWAGTLLNFIMVGQVMVYLVRLIRIYSEIFQVWLFPNLPVLEFSIIICFIIGYVVMGGIRNIGGLALLSFIYMIPFFQILNFTVPYLRFSNMLPLFDHSLISVIRSSYSGANLYLGFELIIYYYPFLSQPEKAKKWAFIGILTTLILYLNLTIVGTAFATKGALENTIWPLMSLLKTLQIPFFNHAEKLATVFFVWTLVPNVCLCTWIITRGLKFTFPAIKQKYLMLIVLLLACGLITSITSGNQIRIINQIFGTSGLIIIYVYLPVLLACQWLHKKVRKAVK
ncbi:spore germination protein [Sporolactobacillus shoreicorticis]|uniref:GerAB/ArcD/ProY family transporter n=1 Tax=Sporolactobacillus shoreicorticis TaxID=1923877 RepID=A0ABW5S1G7_9BACL|nr:GerAB/ArcD/ProY family transporter [Sporolactobacillus shoreicorticis]MCO7124645.1 spore germination protein [Sporolactobacillus shoreicorticis]